MWDSKASAPSAACKQPAVASCQGVANPVYSAASAPTESRTTGALGVGGPSPGAALGENWQCTAPRASASR